VQCLKLTRYMHCVSSVNEHISLKRCIYLVSIPESVLQLSEVWKWYMWISISANRMIGKVSIGASLINIHDRCMDQCSSAQCITRGVQCSSAIQPFHIMYYQGQIQGWTKRVPWKLLFWQSLNITWLCADKFPNVQYSCIGNSTWGRGGWEPPKK